MSRRTDPAAAKLRIDPCAIQIDELRLKELNALVVGVANEHSIAWGIETALREAGAELALNFLNEKAASPRRHVGHTQGPYRD